MKTQKDLIELVKDKKVLYVATKNCEYIRIRQEIVFLQKWAKNVKVVCFKDTSYIKRICKSYMELIRTDVKDYDIIFVGFMAQMLIPAWYWKWRRQLIITDFFISIYDTLVFDRKKVKEKSIFARLLKWVDTTTIRKSDYLVSDTKEHAKYFCEELEAKREKIFVMYLEADKILYHPLKIRRPTWLKNKFVVLYFGSILPVQGVEVVLQAIKILKNNDDIHFLIIGPIKKKIEKIYTPNVTYIDWLPQEKLAKAIAYADICLAGHFSANVNKAQRTIPGKAYIYKAMEKPMILGNTPANRELFIESDTCCYVPVGDPTQLAMMILKKKGDK